MVERKARDLVKPSARLKQQFSQAMEKLKHGKADLGGSYVCRYVCDGGSTRACSMFGSCHTFCRVLEIGSSLVFSWVSRSDGLGSDVCGFFQ